MPRATPLATPLPAPYQLSPDDCWENESSLTQWSLSKARSPSVGIRSPSVGSKDESQTQWSLASKYTSPSIAAVPTSAVSKSTPASPSPRLEHHRNAVAAADVSARHSTAVGHGLSTADVGVGASFVVYGADQAGRPVLSVGLLSTILAVNLAGPGHATHRFESLTDGSVRVWYTPSVSGKYLLRVGVRTVKNGTSRIAALPSSPFTVQVMPSSASTGRGATRGHRDVDRGAGLGTDNDGAGGSIGGRRDSDGGGSGTMGGGRGDAEEDASSPRRRWSSSSGVASAVKATDMLLRTPRGLMAVAVAGERCVLELLAPLLGGGRVELPGRMQCVLHLQSAWCEPPGAGKRGVPRACCSPATRVVASRPSPPPPPPRRLP